MFWRNLKVWPVGVGTSCHTDSSHSSFHWIRAAAVSTVLAPHNISFTQTCQIRPLAHSMGVSHPSSYSPRAHCLPVNAERLYFLEGRQKDWVVVVLSWLDKVVVSTCSMFFCHQGMGVWQSVTLRLLESWTRSSQKVTFLKNCKVFCKQFSMMLLQVSENIFNKVVSRRNARFHFLTCFSPGRYLIKALRPKMSRRSDD